jgi:hypothetical protein
MICILGGDDSTHDSLLKSIITSDVKLELIFYKFLLGTLEKSQSGSNP